MSVEKRLIEIIDRELLPLHEVNNNLGKKNSFYRVSSKPISIWIRTGSKQSNASYGNSKIMRPVWKKALAYVGDEIHNLHGGQYYVNKKTRKGLPVRFTGTGKEPYWAAFERYDDYDKWPLNILKKIEDKKELLARYSRIN